MCNTDTLIHVKLLFREYLNVDETEWLDEMIKNKYKDEDIVKYFLKHGKGREVSDLETSMKELIEGGSLSDDEVLEILKSKLGPQSILEMEELFLSGVSKSEIIKGGQ